MKRRGPQKFKPKLPVGSVREQALAKKIACFYLRKLKARNIYARPWTPGVELDELPVFSQFIKTARAILSSHKDGGPEIPWQDFIAAQFEEWNGPSHVSPLPSQLNSQGAFDRYQRWLDSKNEEGVVSTKQMTAKQKYAAENLYLSRLAESDNSTARKTLIASCAEFSKGFLKYKGVWDRVQTKWEKFHKED